MHSEIYRRVIGIPALVLLIWSISVSPLWAEPLKVGTIERPPFSFSETDGATGQRVGFSVEIWEAIAERLDLDFEWVPYTVFGDMVADASGGQIDLAIANISITAARERIGDFSQPIFESGTAIAVKREAEQSVLGLIWESGILWFLLGALLLVFIVANVVWFFERGIEDARHDYFRDDYIGGVWDAFWWAFIILTMGGFEKEVPHKIINRLLAMMWIVVSLFFISTLTARITTALTVAELRTGIESWQDLAGKHVGVTAGSTQEAFFDSRNIETQRYDTFDALLDSLKAGQTDAIVADMPVLSWYLSKPASEWMMLAGETFNIDNYGILFPDDALLLEAIDTELLSLREEGVYREIHERYFSR